MNNQSGLGELLRYVADLVDQGSEKIYVRMNLDYRARYTPVLRAIGQGATTVTDITFISKLTQSAISQSVRLMEEDNLLERYVLADARKSRLVLTEKGQALLDQLKIHWDIVFKAIEQLEQDVQSPLLLILEKTAGELDRISFDERILQAQKKIGSKK